MGAISIEDQRETVGLSTPVCQFRQQSNVLDLLGLSDSLPRTACRAEKFVLPEEENYGRPSINLVLLGKR